MLKRFFKRSNNDIEQSVTAAQSKKMPPSEHNKSEFKTLIDALKRGCPEPKKLNHKELEYAFLRFSEQNNLGLSLRTKHVTSLSPERLQRLYDSDYYRPTIHSGIEKIARADEEFSWHHEKDMIGALFVDRGVFLMVRVVNKKIGLNRRWIYDFHIATRIFA